LKKKIILKTMMTLLFVVSASVSFLNILGMDVTAQGTEISILEAVSGSSTITVGEEGVPVNATNPTPPFTVNVTVSNVNDLYAWGILLLFNNATLNCSEEMVWLPEDHVFSYVSAEKYTEVGPFVEYDELQDSWAIHYGFTLMGTDIPLFSGSGTLCQINFTGIAAGVSSLTIPPTDPRTALKTPDPESPTGLKSIAFDVNDGNVQVIPEFPTFAITPLLIILTIIIVIISKITWSKKLRRSIVAR